VFWQNPECFDVALAQWLIVPHDRGSVAVCSDALDEIQKEAAAVVRVERTQDTNTLRLRKRGGEEAILREHGSSDRQHPLELFGVGLDLDDLHDLLRP
jgi:hypothetical protein